MTSDSTWSPGQWPMILIPGQRTCILASPEPGSSEMLMRILKGNKSFGWLEKMQYVQFSTIKEGAEKERQ